MTALRLLNVTQEENGEWKGELSHTSVGKHKGERWYTLHGPSREDITRQANRLKAAHLKSEGHHTQDRRAEKERLDRYHKGEPNG